VVLPAVVLLVGTRWSWERPPLPARAFLYQGGQELGDAPFLELRPAEPIREFVLEAQLDQNLSLSISTSSDGRVFRQLWTVPAGSAEADGTRAWKSPVFRVDAPIGFIRLTQLGGNDRRRLSQLVLRPPPRVVPHWILIPIVWFLWGGLMLAARASRGSATATAALEWWSRADLWIAASLAYLVLFRVPFAILPALVFVGLVLSIRQALRSARPRLAMVLSVAGLSVLFFLPTVIREIAEARVARIQHAEADHRLLPDPQRQINEDGIRFAGTAGDLEEEDFVVLFLGDAYTFGEGVDYEQAYPYVFERMAGARMEGRAVRAVNFGWASSSPLLSLRLLQEIGEKYRPDLVIYNLDMSDFHDDLVYQRELGEVSAEAVADTVQRFYDDYLSWLRLGSEQVERLRALQGLETPARDPETSIPADRFFVTSQPLEASRSYMERGVMKNLLAMERYCRDVLRVPMAVVVYPRHYQYSIRESPDNWERNAYTAQGPYVREPFRYLAEASDELPYPLIDLLPSFESSEEFPLYQQNDPHWTPAGHRLAAGAVLKALSEHGLLGSSRTPIAPAESTRDRSPADDLASLHQQQHLAAGNARSPEETVRDMRLPDGFSATVFAGEPDVVQPIAMTIDGRGRLWVAENYSYPHWSESGNDRILIFEDRDGDGQFDERKIFWDEGGFVSAIQVGFGGVFVGSAPYLLFIPDADRDDVPDAKPRILLDGFGYQDTHEMMNSLAWGPDGWLYGLQGVFVESLVGAPGTPEHERVRMNAGVFRYHPIRREFELFAEGGGNLWGLDFDDHGQCFVTANVVPHLYHMSLGGRYERQAGAHFNPYTFEDISAIADHLHSKAAYAGAMIYLADQFPERYRNKLFLNNIHSNRIHTDELVRRGSTFVGKLGPHGRDDPDSSGAEEVPAGVRPEFWRGEYGNGGFMVSEDPWIRGLSLQQGPEGAVFLSDWYDKYACHGEPAYDRRNGRIYRIGYRGIQPARVDMENLSDAALVEHQRNRNDWYVRQSRRLLQERAASNELGPGVHPALQDMLYRSSAESQKLRALWALHVTNGLTEAIVLDQLQSPMEYVRAWVVQLESEDRKVSAAVLEQLSSMAREDRSPVVRLYLASAAGRLPLDDRWDLLEGLLGHAEDASDEAIPRMLWYATEPMVPRDPRRALELGLRSRIPAVRRFVARREARVSLRTLVEALGGVSAPAVRIDLLEGLSDGLEGMSPGAVEGWPATYRELMRVGDERTRELALEIALRFGEAEAVAETKSVARNRGADTERRREAIRRLVQARVEDLASLLNELVSDEAVRADAIRGLAVQPNARTAEILLAAYSSFTLEERRSALALLATRADFARALLAGVRDGRISKSDLTAETIQQLQLLEDAPIRSLMEAALGSAPGTDKAAEIARYKQVIGSAPRNSADRSRGRLIFSRVCQQCHRLFGSGGDQGPDLTGSDRGDLDFLLLQVVDPSRMVGEPYRTTIVTTTDQRTIAGVVVAEDHESIRIKTGTGTYVLTRREIAERTQLRTSAMPEGLLSHLDESQIRDLVAYLQSREQVPLRESE
jgi:putative membrane-bound dehydrogenase-like protein